MTSFPSTASVHEYCIPEGCPVCAADLPVRVTASGPRSACGRCHWIGRPRLTVTHEGLRVSMDATANQA